MANWCMNYLRVTGPVEDVARFQKEAAEVKPPRGAAPDATLEALSFERLLPLPPESRTCADEGPMAEWGCRGNAFHSERVECWDGAVGFRFVTPWNPPMVFLQRVSECWPTLVFVLDYEEPRACFRGLARAAKGSLQHFHLDLGAP